MTPTNLTFLRSLKVWWSFFWRAYVLMIPLMFCSLPLFLWIMPFNFPKPGEPMQPPTPPNFHDMPRFFQSFFLIWLLMMGGMLLTQVLAMKWALKARWSDFQLMPVEADRGATPAAAEQTQASKPPESLG